VEDPCQLPLPRQTFMVRSKGLLGRPALTTLEIRFNHSYAPKFSDLAKVIRGENKFA
jgi:hypothetical protein